MKAKAFDFSPGERSTRPRLIKTRATTVRLLLCSLLFVCLQLSTFADYLIDGLSWATLQDYDGDGCVSEATLIVRVSFPYYGWPYYEPLRASVQVKTTDGQLVGSSGSEVRYYPVDIPIKVVGLPGCQPHEYMVEVSGWTGRSYYYSDYTYTWGYPETRWHHRDETVAEDSFAIIEDAWWTDESDFDENGFCSYATLNWRSRAIPGPVPLLVYEEVSRRTSGDSIWTHLTNTAPHQISANSISDLSSILVSPKGPRAKYDYRIRIIRSGQRFSDYEAGPRTDPDLSSHKEESPFYPVSGTYKGLFLDTNHVGVESSGFISAYVASNGRFSAKLRIRGASYPFSGRFSQVGHASTTSVAWPLRQVDLDLDMTGGDALAGQIAGASWLADVVADRDVFDTQKRATPKSGRYTLVLPGHPLLGPSGDSFGTVKIDRSGNITFIGSLSDGSAISQSAALSKDGYWPFYVSLYSGTGSAIGWLQFLDDPTSDVGGRVLWTKPLNASSAYLQ